MCIKGQGGSTTKGGNENIPRYRPAPDFSLVRDRLDASFCGPSDWGIKGFF